MGTRYLVKSAEVLNDADAFQKILDWELFAMEQEARLYGYDGSEVTHRGSVWTPGDPIHGHPHATYDFRAEFQEWTGPWGNHVRPMVEDLPAPDERQYGARCKPCGVSWADGDICWMCEIERPKLPRLPAYYSIVNEYFLTMTIEVPGLSDDLYELLTGRPRVESYSIQDMGHPELSGRYFIEDSTQVPEVQEPVWGTEAFYDPRINLPLLHRVALPSEWSTMAAPIPMPDLPEPPDYSNKGCG